MYQFEKSEGFLPPNALFWELCILSAGIGTLAVAWPLPAILAVFLILVSFSSKLRLLSRFVLFVLSFGAGWLMAAGALHETPPLPGWLGHKSMVVRGRVVQVQGYPGNSLRVYLADAYCVDAPEQKFPGHVLWYAQGDEPAIPGQTVTVRLRVKPVHGFANAHCFDTERYWAMHGVWYRGYTDSRDTRGAEYTGNGYWWARLHETVRQRVRAALLGKKTAGANHLSDSFLNTRDRTGRSAGPGKAVLPALIMNDRSLLRVQDMALLGKACLSHSIALSGLHLGFMLGLGMLLTRLFCRFFPGLLLCMPRQVVSLLVGVPLASLYLWLGGASATLVRAAWMFAAFGVMLFLRRRSWLIDGVFVALLGLLCLDPLALHKLGVQLSLIAVCTLAFCQSRSYRFYPEKNTEIPSCNPITSCNFKTDQPQNAALSVNRAPPFWSKLVRRIGMCILVSLLIQLGALPILAWNFWTISPWFFLNILWLPVLGCFVFPVALAGTLLAGLGYIEAAELMFTMAAWPADILFFCLETLETHHLFPVWTVTRPHWLTVLGFYAALAGLIHALLKQRKKSVALTCLAAFLCLIAFALRYTAENPGLARLTVFDVGYGQSLLVETPGNTRVLIDGGGRLLGPDPGKFAVTPALIFNRTPALTTVINTHPDVDHLRGLIYILETMDVQTAYFNGPLPDTEDGHRIRNILERKKIKPHILRQGDELILSQDISLETLYPDKERDKTPNNPQKDKNNHSLVLRLKDRHTGKGLALLSGDIEKRGLQRLLRTNPDIQSDILVLPHHGSASSMLAKFYDATQPGIAIASCGFRNAWGFPSDSVRNALKERGIALLTTADSGQITVEWTSLHQKPRISTLRKALE